jgi:uncharacterized protein (TIGR02246 family)
MNRWIICVLVLLLECPLAAAQAVQDGKRPTAVQNNADLDAIRAAVNSYVEAYNRGDAKAVANLWSESADWISPSGERFQGRVAIEREMEDMFAENKGLRIEVIEPTVRLVASDAAVEEGTVRVTRPGSLSSNSTYIAVHAKKNGQWKLESVRETSVPEVFPHEQLKQLEWLIGEWVDESPNQVVEHNFKWSEDGHYLLGKFTVRWEGLPAMKGDVRIGWDPLTKQIKSWIFDTEGGRAEGFWTKIDDRWVVKLTGVRPDGTTASATNTYIPMRRDQYQYTSVDRIVGDRQEPDQSVVIVRKPPEPKTSDRVESSK